MLQRNVKLASRFRLSMAGFLLIAAIAAKPAVAVQCGVEISTDVKLTSDLNCAGNALFIVGPLPNAPNITIDLNGHNVTGNGTGIGIFVTDGHVIVKGKGRVSNFSIGVSLISAIDVLVYDLTLDDNQTGINVALSHEVRIFDNTIRAGRSGEIGVFMSVVRNLDLFRNAISGFSQFGVLFPSGDPPDVSFPVISENIIHENQTGISIRGLDSDSIIRGNFVFDNELNGIEIGPLFEAGCTIEDNQVKRNGGHGIVIKAGAQAGCAITDNFVQGNQLGGISILEGSGFNQLIQVEGNRLSHNGTDLIWDGLSNSCWLQNVFVTSSPAVLPPCS